MDPEPFRPGQAGLSIGSESIPFTMQVQGSHMTIDEAVASGLFDVPDEPGMVRIPISINVMIPGHLLEPPEPAADHDPADGS